MLCYQNRTSVRSNHIQVIFSQIRCLYLIKSTHWCRKMFRVRFVELMIFSMQCIWLRRAHWLLCVIETLVRTDHNVISWYWYSRNNSVTPLSHSYLSHSHRQTFRTRTHTTFEYYPCVLHYMLFAACVIPFCDYYYFVLCFHFYLLFERVSVCIATRLCDSVVVFFYLICLIEFCFEGPKFNFIEIFISRNSKVKFFTENKTETQKSSEK